MDEKKGMPRERRLVPRWDPRLYPMAVMTGIPEQLVPMFRIGIDPMEEAQHFESKGDYLVAARTYNKYAEFFGSGDKPKERARELYKKIGEKDEKEEDYLGAHRNYDLAGLHEKAQIMLRKQAEKEYRMRSFGNAAEYFERAGFPGTAKEMWKKEAENAEEKKDFNRASFIYEKIGFTDKAEEMDEKYKGLISAERARRKKLDLENRVVEKNADNAVKRGHYNKAIRIYEELGEREKAIETRKQMTAYTLGEMAKEAEAKGEPITFDIVAAPNKKIKDEYKKEADEALELGDLYTAAKYYVAAYNMKKLDEVWEEAEKIWIKKDLENLKNKLRKKWGRKRKNSDLESRVGAF